MRQIPLTQGRVALIDDDAWQDVGIFTWHTHNSRSKPYAASFMLGKKFLMHRFIMGVLDEPTLQVDHIDGDGLNNQRSNLRICTAADNAKNVRRQSNSAGYKGVTLAGEKYRAAITSNGTVYRLGTYPTPEAAALAYNEAAIKLHGEFASLNTIPTQAA